MQLNFKIYFLIIAGLALFLAGVSVYFLDFKGSGSIILQAKNENFPAALETLPPNIISSQNSSVSSSPSLPPDDCVSATRLVKVRGSSLSGLVEDGDTLKIFVDYYKCHKIERGDLVVYQYASNQDPLVKIVKGIEGDKFRLEKSPLSCGWNLLINGSILKNSSAAPYCLSAQGFRMLSLYENDYKGVIPAGALLILGNSVGGSLDSTRFGLIDNKDLMGKAVKAARE